ncbi:MAG: SCO family protein [Deltaproteobacteria bacterium]|nr:SCO family protein [Deltaproteobacteria bacterium]
MNFTQGRLWMALATATPTLLSASSAWAQYGLGVHTDNSSSTAATNRMPTALADVTVTEHLRAQLPLDVVLTDSHGVRRRLGDFLDGRRPLLINMAYYRCPVLCSLVSNGVVNGLRSIAWNVGDQFDVLTVSIDPHETAQDATARQARVADQYARAGGSRGWHFTVGEEAQVRRLADALGFGYRYDQRQNQYAHPAVVFLVTPSGRVARYLYGISFQANDLRLGLLEASEGRAISTVERVLLFCYHYDPQDRRYALVARQVMKIGGGITALLFGGGLFLLWLKELRRSRANASNDHAGGPGQSNDNASRAA